uniref:G-protein signaling modulator 3 n=1 Tax=Nothobranchius furzeri TaxID=105023 RepID=A0A8C6KTQ2_NOTFU
MISAAPSGLKKALGGGDATRSPTPENQLTEVGMILEAVLMWWSMSSCSQTAPNVSFCPLPCPFKNLLVFFSPLSSVVFSSMTSLQKEEFFDLVATAQARRLDDQRAHLGKSAAPKPKCRIPVPKEDLYDMILTTQAQGRLEDQRSRAPGPMDDDDFFSLLLRVQGGRMDEQRTELPRLLQT